MGSTHFNAKCPNCGAVLELPANLDRAFCIHCGGKVIIAKDVHYHGAKPAIACPECEGRGYCECIEGINTKAVTIESLPFQRWIIAPCKGSGKCEVKYLINDGIIMENWIDSGNICNKGRCRTCQGTGKVGIFTKKPCKWCEGTGNCPICDGTGKCSFCDGNRKIKCEYCNGTGFKVYEGGE